MTDTKYGHLSIYEHLKWRERGIWLRVLLNGEDVTDRCTEANDELGYAVLNKLKEGRTFIEDGMIARVRCTGDVRFVKSEPWTTPPPRHHYISE